MKNKYKVPKKPEIRKLKKYEAYWLAGVIDGEGSIGLYKLKKGGRIVVIQMANTNKPFVTRMKKIIGCGSQINRINLGESHKGRKPMYMYCLKGHARCYWILKQISSYLIIKKQKALSIIKELENKPFGRWKNKTEKSRLKASRKTKLSWKNPIIRARRLKGMKKQREKIL